MAWDLTTRGLMVVDESRKKALNLVLFCKENNSKGVAIRMFQLKNSAEVKFVVIFKENMPGWRFEFYSFGDEGWKSDKF